MFSQARKVMKLAVEKAERLTPSPETCNGSIKHPNCRLPLYFIGEQKDVRNKIIYAYQVSRVCHKNCHLTIKDFPEEIVTRICPQCGGPLVDDETDHQIYGEIFDKCFCCIIEHPSIRKYVGNKAVKTSKYMRKLMSVKYDT